MLKENKHYINLLRTVDCLSTFVKFVLEFFQTFFIDIYFVNNFQKNIDE